MKKITQFSTNMENLTEQEQEQLIALINKGNMPLKKRWRGKKNDVYYFIGSAGKITKVREDKFTYDSSRYQLGNYFKTKEETEFELNKRLVYQELKDFALEHNEMGIDWKNSEQEKWVISYDNQSKHLVYRDRYALSDIGQIYFTSDKIAKRAVKVVGEDRIKKYLFNVEY